VRWFTVADVAERSRAELIGACAHQRADNQHHRHWNSAGVFLVAGAFVAFFSMHHFACTGRYRPTTGVIESGTSHDLPSAQGNYQILPRTNVSSLTEATTVRGLFRFGVANAASGSDRLQTRAPPRRAGIAAGPDGRRPKRMSELRTAPFGQVRSASGEVSACRRTVRRRGSGSLRQKDDEPGSSPCRLNKQTGGISGASGPGQRRQAIILRLVGAVLSAPALLPLQIKSPTALRTRQGQSDPSWGAFSEADLADLSRRSLHLPYVACAWQR
jgi:hypothetical protein